MIVDFVGMKAFLCFFLFTIFHLCIVDILGSLASCTCNGKQLSRSTIMRTILRLAEIVTLMYNYYNLFYFISLTPVILFKP